MPSATRRRRGPRSRKRARRRPSRRPIGSTDLRKILALDLSLNTGWAVGTVKPVFGVFFLGKRDSETGDGPRFTRLIERAGELIAEHRPDLVIYEMPISKQQTSARLLICLGGMVEVACAAAKVRCREENSATARKLVLGRGGWRRQPDDPRSPSDMAKAAVKEWCDAQGWISDSHDARDAILLWRYAHLMSRTTVMAGAGSGQRAL